MISAGQRSDAAPAHGGVLGVDLGGTRLRVAVFDSSGTMVHKAVVPTPHDHPEALAVTMKEALAWHPGAVEGAVVGVPGPVSYAEGRAFDLVNIAEWHQHVSAQKLSGQLGLPVLLANDADLAAFGGAPLRGRTGSRRHGVPDGEHRRRRRCHHRRSTPAWTSIARRGGTHDHRLDDRRLGRGPWLGYGARREGRGRRRGRDREGEGRRRARPGRPTGGGGSVAIGVHNVVLCFMPQRVVIGGGMSQAGDLLLDPIRERLEHCQLCSISGKDVVLASCGDDVGLLGAYAFWRDASGPAASKRRSGDPSTGQRP